MKCDVDVAANLLYGNGLMRNDFSLVMFDPYLRLFSATKELIIDVSAVPKKSDILSAPPGLPSGG